MTPNTRRTVVKLSQCAPGTPFRLFSKYRDKSPRPRLKFGPVFLAQHELTVVEQRDHVTLVSLVDKGVNKVIPLSAELRIAL